MSRLRILILALALALGLTVAVLPGLAGASVSQQCSSTSSTCMNFWNGGYVVRTYQGYAANNAIAIHWLGNGTFELRDGIHGGCVGDYGGGKNNPQMGGGNLCPSTSGTSAGWGTTFQLVSSSFCSSGSVLFWAKHWLAYIGFSPGNNHPVSENTTGTCMFPET